MFPKNLCFILAILLFNLAYGQKQNNHWIYDVNNGVDFNTTPPSYVASNFSYLPNYIEVTAVMSNRNTGNLMFYTDGYKVFDHNLTPMPNGYGIGNDTPRYSNRQGTVIVPLPGDTNRYYVFTVNDILVEGSLRYSIVDMKLNGGLGDVVPGQKGIFIDKDFAEAMTVVKGNDCSLWLLLIKRAKNEIYAYKITNAGLSTSPIISVFTAPVNHFSSLLKVGDNNMMCFSLLYSSSTETCLMKFDPATGQCSGFTTITNLTAAAVSYEFSPSGKYLYLFDKTAVHQYNASLPSMTAIINSKQSLSYGTTISAPYCANVASDGNIYFTQIFNKDLSVLYNPELAFPGFNVILNSFKTPAGTISGGYCLASKVVLADEAITTVHTETLCDNMPVTLHGPGGAQAYKWQDGSSNSSLQVYGAGTYWVQSFDGCRYQTDTFITEHLQHINLGNDTTICEGAQLILDTKDNLSTHLWSTGATGSQIIVDTAGVYSVVLTRNGCTVTDTIRVGVQHVSVSLPADTSICAGITYHIQLPDTFDTYKWNVGNTNVIDVSQPGTYWVQVTRSGCTAADTIVVKVLRNNTIDLGADKYLCNGEEVDLSVHLADGAIYTWQNDSADTTYHVTAPGKYWLKAINKCGEFSDTVSVYYENCDCRAFIPNAFTPNNDGLNDKLKPILDCNVSSYLFVVANRFGEIVFKSNDPNERWDGRYKGVACDMNTFFYYVKITGPRDKSFFFKGDVVLLR